MADVQRRLEMASRGWVCSEGTSALQGNVSLESIQVVILARDEAGVLAGTIRALMIQMDPADQVHVVADHCRDRTAQIASREGARVHIRRDGGPAGKGQALRWWLQKTHRHASGDEIIVVLDADSRVAPNFFDTIRQRMVEGQEVVQCRVEPIVHSDSPVSHLAAFSETVEQRVNDALRAHLGWPVRLRGTGMAFRRHILERICQSLQTLVEDVELTVQLGAMGVPIHFAPETYVADPKPNDQKGAMRQRARWLKGQLQVVRAYLPQILRLAARGPQGWSLLSAVLLKPKALILPLKAALTAVAWLAAGMLGGWLWLPALLGALSLAFDVGVLFYGVRFTSDRPQALRCLAQSPLYLAMWIQSLALSAISGNEWHRVRPVQGRAFRALRPPEILLMESLMWAESRLPIHNQAQTMANHVPSLLAESGD
jgi:cellulose synthase/poly-beta-1,6-N-acetylglucosamine synthase-like glycosyltransferase